MPEPLVGRLASFAHEAMHLGVPEVVEGAVVERIIDTTGVALAAVGHETARVVRDVVAHNYQGSEATVLGTGEQRSMLGAAFVNGTLAHALDFDDTHLPSVLHPSAVVVPAALAVAEHVGASGEQLVRAVAVGDEVTCRLGMAAYDPALRNSIFFENGLHATSICGALGAAAAGAGLLGLDTDKIAHALAIAASLGSGILEANRTGGSVKRIHCGWAAQAGITAAVLAEAGLTGPRTALEGRFGFFRAFSEGRFSDGDLISELGTRWEMARLFTKPYPANHFTHAGIDAARQLVASGVDPANIDAIELGVAEPTLRTIAEPVEEKANPESGYHAKFSGPMTVALALLGGGGLGLAEEDFSDDRVKDPEVQRLARLVSCRSDHESNETFPRQFPGVLRVTLGDGAVAEHRVSFTRGGPENPLTQEELLVKFRVNTIGLLGEERAIALQEVLGRLVEAPSVKPLFELTHVLDAAS